MRNVCANCLSVHELDPAKLQFYLNLHMTKSNQSSPIRIYCHKFGIIFPLSVGIASLLGLIYILAILRPRKRIDGCY